MSIWRSIVRRKGISVAVVLTLAVVIGASTVIFSLVHGILLRPLPYPEPERVVTVWPELWLSKGMFERLAEEATSFEAIGAYSGGALVVKEGGESTLAPGPEVTPGFLRALGVVPEIGRSLVEGDDRPGAAPVVILEHSHWQRRFDGDRDVVGTTMAFEGGPRTIVGVLPPGVELLQEDAEIVYPIVLDPDAGDYEKAQYLKVVGRLRPGVDLQTADAEARAIAGRWATERNWSEETVLEAGVVPLRERLVGEARPLLLVLTGAVGLLLAIAAANLVHLFLAAGTSRFREMAIRTALGASRRRLAFTFVGEALVLGLVGASLGILAGTWLVPLVVRLAPFDLPRLAAVDLGGTAIAFGFVLAGSTALAASGAAIVGILRGRPESGLREEGRGRIGSRSTNRLRRVLVAAEVAIAMVVLVGGALLVKSFWHLTLVEPGFEPKGLFTAVLLSPEERIGDPETARSLYGRLLEDVRAVPGVESAALVNALPVGGGGWVMETHAEGVEIVEGESNLAYWRVATPGYLDTLGVPLVAGRGLTASDRSDGRDVAVVDRPFVDRFWPGQEAVGRRFRMPFEGEDWITIVGVVEGTRHLGMRQEPVPTVYRPLDQALDTLAGIGVRQLALIARTEGGSASVGPGLVRSLQSAEPDVAVVRPVAMESHVAGSLAEPRVLAMTLMGFASAAVLLAVIGVFGIVSRLVSERTPEIALRRVLGASVGDVLRLVLGRSLAPVGLGIVLGGLGGAASARALASFLYEVRPADPLALVASATLLAAVALTAAFLPARRASRIEPNAALE